MGAIKLCNDRTAIVQKNLVNPVFVGVELQQPPVTLQPNRIQRIEHNLWVEASKGRHQGSVGRHGPIVRVANLWPGDTASHQQLTAWLGRRYRIV